MKKYFIILLLFFACSNEEQQSTESASIPEDVMIEMIIDFALCDALVENQKLATNELITQKKLSLYEAIFNKYNYNSKEYEEAYKIYSEDLIHFNEMYDIVLEEISKREIELKP